MSDRNDDYFIQFSQDEESLLKSRNGSRNKGSSRRSFRQGSLVRPERNQMSNPRNPHYYYARKAQENMDRIDIESSNAGLRNSLKRNSMASNPRNSFFGNSRTSYNGGETDTGVYMMKDLDQNDMIMNEDTQQRIDSNEQKDIVAAADPTIRQFRNKKQSASLWFLYCTIITFWAPAPLLSLFGMPKKERQAAWREKIALISIIIYIGAFVAYLTFGFSRTVCKKEDLRFRNNAVSTGYLIINGKAYNLESSSHPAAAGIEAGTNILYPPINAGGKDASFLFQNVNGNCLGLIKPKDNCSIPYDSEGNLAWYFPCKPFAQDGSTKPNFTKSEYYEGWACHTSQASRDAYYSLKSSADVYFTWDDIRNSSRNLAVFSGHVLDLDLLNWLEKDDLDYPHIFDELQKSNFQGYDLSLFLSTGEDKKIGRCLTEIIKVGEIDSKSVGCIASDVVLYVSLVFILSIVISKFLVACYFRWFVSLKQGASVVDNKTMAKHSNDIEDWSNNINSQGPIKDIPLGLRPAKHTSPFGDENESVFDVFKKRGSKLLDLNESTMDLDTSFTTRGDLIGPSVNGMTTMTTQNTWKSTAASTGLNTSKSRPMSALLPTSSSIAPWDESVVAANEYNGRPTLNASNIHLEAIQQPPVDYMPFGFPLVHTICFVTCYSEDEEGLRTTLDSLSTTDYPNSHKLIMIVCDGLVKGSGNDKTTPEIALEMMEDFIIPSEDVQAYSYVAVASGSKRHNMAKVYAGFYKYDDATVLPEKQQRVPVITIVKCGTPDEQGSAKPGNRGKRDSQVILMSFLQRITFDERMTELEFQLLQNIWQLTGLMADFYETVLMVDADTKVFPDSLTHMVAEMVRDPLIMGLCGETKIANKLESWVTAIQVFEYYISHHQSKAFETVFGSVTCLPGCFSLYRIKCPKGTDGYWVPILANPDIVERYSDNVTKTLHKKNLLLLGEDRYLSSLMLATFPKRKQVFVPKAACKTIVPNKFKVLLSQRRRWINSTVHNLFELVLVRDLCGTFCFSMQFVIAIELIGTLVLPLAICFTIYVIVFAIVSKPTPVLTLVLLAIILGLPGILVVVTATRWSYILWLGIYLIALPVWNLVLPSYAYWKFDDFSWGDTRTISGGAGTGHEELEGEFDHSKIKMRTWREFEREYERDKIIDS